MIARMDGSLRRMRQKAPVAPRAAEESFRTYYGRAASLWLERHDATDPLLAEAVRRLLARERRRRGAMA